VELRPDGKCPEIAAALADLESYRERLK
jgi:hypothetical protein